MRPVRKKVFCEDRTRDWYWIINTIVGELSYLSQQLILSADDYPNYVSECHRGLIGWVIRPEVVSSRNFTEKAKVFLRSEKMLPLPPSETFSSPSPGYREAEKSCLTSQLFPNISFPKAFFLYLSNIVLPIQSNRDFSKVGHVFISFILEHPDLPCVKLNVNMMHRLCLVCMETVPCSVLACAYIFQLPNHWLLVPTQGQGPVFQMTNDICLVDIRSLTLCKIHSSNCDPMGKKCITKHKLKPEYKASSVNRISFASRRDQLDFSLYATSLL